jgi:myo-inositol 2-dehydrogenase/D-chiro-inositol 1-dehydrogenase
MRVGIVGAGTMGQAHAAAWKNLASKGAELAGFLSRSGSAEKLAKEYNVKHYTDYASMLADVDIVDLCVPTDRHKDMTVEAAQAGKHVICEKPIALTLDDGRAMIDACEKAVVASGQIGKPAVIRLTRASYPPHKAIDNWFLDEVRSGGMILDLMIHDYDYARWIAGDVTRVYARSARAMRPEAEGDYALVTLRFASGAIAHIEGGWAYPPGFFRTSIDIAGTDGLLEWSSDRTQPVQTHLKEAAVEQAGEVALPPSFESESPFDIQLGHFYDALVHNKPFSISARDALAALQIGLAARKALVSGQAVSINQEAL